MSGFMENVDYHVQDDIKCCANCEYVDTVIDVVGGKELVCGLYSGEGVDPAGVCTSFEW
jgi:hypothetical protein